MEAGWLYFSFWVFLETLTHYVELGYQQLEKFFGCTREKRKLFWIGYRLSTFYVLVNNEVLLKETSYLLKRNKNMAIFSPTFKFCSERIESVFIMFVRNQKDHLNVKITTKPGSNRAHISLCLRLIFYVICHNHPKISCPITVP